MDYERISSELLRALRGERSQTAFARRLKYKSNIVYSWESGRAFPTAARTLWAAERTGVDVAAAISQFVRQQPPWLTPPVNDYQSAVVHLLSELKGRRTLVELSSATGLSRFTIARWLKKAAEPRLPDFLKLVDVCSLRLLDFLALLCEPKQLPSIARQWAELEAARKATYESPWTQAVLRCLELKQYAQLSAHEGGWIAKRIGISRQQEELALTLLQKSGQVEHQGGKYAPLAESRTLDTRQDPERAMRLRAFWAEVALERLQAGSDGLFAHNVFNVSEKDHQRLRELQKAYYQEVRAIVSQSEPEERVLLLNLQLLSLD